jgi:hypothetical protein
MKKTSAFFFMALLFSITTMAQEHQGPPPLEGRWDINVDWNGKQQPAWLEVRHSGINKLVGRIMIVSGSARPISKINYKDGTFNFTIPPQWDNSDVDIKIEGTLAADKLTGTIQNFDGKVYAWEGVRAPSLKRTKPTEWGAPIALFNGKDLTGWHTNGPNQWVVETGVLKSPKSGSNLFSDQSFKDFKLHIEFRYPKGSNSGVYLRGRYEVQVADSKGLEPWDDQLGGVYGLLSPNEMVAKEAGEWQTYDITLVGRTVTIVANGVAVISNQVIPGVTGGAIDSKEGEPGPFMIQGDHGPVEYRNIVVIPAK